MKKNNRNRQLHIVRRQQSKCPKYPNAADPSYFTQKAVDMITAVISGMGFVSAMIFLVTMS